ncbi:RNA methyltransferase [Fulvivirga lutea]|uniref:RNA methyltransferase n=1 Tax=Fulvivirga lutea TaxID=2810512 RepID=A0A974WJE2_9BACT|nr:RNA methyltransferase [Fulvivirga lutea]QSE98302.1 RNA methyltransferase [Fulvivirga lutea]
MRKIPNEELDRKSVDEFKAANKIPVVILLDNIRSLNNVGSAFRTSDAFLVEKIYLGGITGIPPHREIQKTALGATESVEWEHVADVKEAVGQLKKDGYTIISIEQVENSISLEEFEPKKDEKYCLIFGNEVFGVDQDVVNLSDLTIEIPQYGTKHSLNISVSLGIVIWEFFRKLS